MFNNGDIVKLEPNNVVGYYYCFMDGGKSAIVVLSELDCGWYDFRVVDTDSLKLVKLAE